MTNNTFQINPAVWQMMNQTLSPINSAPITPPQPAPTPQVSDTVNLITENPINSLTGQPYKKRALKREEKIYNLTLLEAFRHKFKSVEDGEIGLEIECEGTNLFDKPISWWRCHQDHSLRAVEDHPPVEYVLRKPISREDVPKALDYLNKKLRETGSNISMSSRTSVHLHVNCLRMTVKEIYQFICLYLIFEETLTDFAGPDRVGNLFCLGGKHAEYWVQMLESAIQTENFNEVFNENIRYTACNTASLGKFGSLEFRALRGTVDEGVIQTWIDLILAIRDKAMEFKDPREIVDRFQRTSPQDFMREVFKRNDLRNIFLSRPDLHKSMWDGMRLMRDIAYAVEWLPRKEKKVLEEENEPVNPQSTQTPDLSLWTPLGFETPCGFVTHYIEITPRVYLCEYEGMSLDWVLENFNDTNKSVIIPVTETQVTIGPRERYLIRKTTGMFNGEWPEIQEGEEFGD
jgi:hypothetical protein